MENLALQRIHLQTIMGIDLEGSDIDDLSDIDLLLHLFKHKSQLLKYD